MEPPVWSSSTRWTEYTPYLIAGGLAFALVLSLPAVFGPAVSAAIAVWGVWWWRRERQRRQRLCELAAAKGWTDAARDDSALVSWQADGTSPVTWRPGRQDPDKLEREAAFLARLADLVSAAADGHR